MHNQDGSTTTTLNGTSRREDGFTSQITSTLVENEDGSSILTTTRANQDGTSSVYEKTTNSDGSSQSTTTNYDSDGNQTSAVDENVDLYGNVSTRNAIYDDAGGQKVVGYDIDTSDNPNGYKEFNADGVNTGFYGFYQSEGFRVNMHFTIDFNNQPPYQDGNFHNILTMKRADPSPWYGFQIRHNSRNKSL